MLADLSLLDHTAEWAQLCSLVCIRAERYHKARGNTERQTCYYISSLQPDAKRLNAAIYQHWGIENPPRRTLGAGHGPGDDLSHKQTGHAAENSAWLNRIALNLLKARQNL